MKYYLDEDINIQLTITTAEYFRQNNYTIYKEDELVFKGTAYIPANKDSIIINCNDIVSTYKPNYTTSSTGEYPLSNNYTIVLDDSLSGDISVTFEVVYIYRYPNKNYDYTLDGVILLGEIIPRFPITNDVYFNSIGLNNYSTAPYSSEIKYIVSDESEKYIIRKVDKSEFTTNVDRIIANCETTYVLYCNSIEVEPGTVEVLVNAGIPEANAIKVCNEGSGVLIIEDDEEYISYGILPNLTSLRISYELLTQPKGGKIVAYIDRCPSRYYLKWIDRKGGIQCQPFKNKDVYSEDISTQTIRNFTGHKRKVFWDITSKWEINTDWLSDDVYAVYESIYLSPYLELIDTEQNKVHSVILTNESYTEKTYKNQKQMFNMSLSLVADKNQNIYN